MKTNSDIAKTPSEIASELFQGTKVESAFDKRGKFSHLLARLSKNEFFKLYSPNTTVTIFIQGYWLQLCLKDKNKIILNRETNSHLALETLENEFGFTTLILSHMGKYVGKFKFRSMTSSEIFETSEGYYAIARAAVRVFTKIQSSFALRKTEMHYLPVVQIMPEEDLEIQFDANLVNIQ
ncbi:hypothetical protein [Fluviispira multicolorata]|uniref:Uncharacterized protein n=1 Tax=Fluviispira multicolorata TaxID=2654512 RepID=A0A833JDZ2_9BACT|nr:hypothetical protein [Fluviispira multicolorata]KAB8032148.1 hypothetical protein GCL57_05740 [Fluviispira multicolorata]